jgi:signal transduction histidine kinase
MQGIFGGVDALTRAARSTKPLSVPLEQVTQFVQQAIGNHERSLDRLLESMAPEQQTPTIVSLRELLTELVRFMTNDTARNGVRVRLDFNDDLKVSALHGRLQLIVLGLLTESIDAMPSGGEMRVGGRTVDGRVHFEILDTRTQPRSTTFVNDAVERLVTELSGRIEHKQIDTGGCEVRVELAAA